MNEAVLGLEMTISVREKHNLGLNQSSGSEERKKKISGRNNMSNDRLTVRREENSKVSRVKA